MRILRTHDELIIEKLKDNEFLAAYIETAFEEYEQDNDLTAFLQSLRNLVKLKGGITKLSKETGLNREHLYKVFENKTNPGFSTLMKIMHYCGITFKIACNF